MTTKPATPQARSLVRSAHFFSATADNTQVASVVLEERPAVAMMFEEVQVAPLSDGGYGRVPTALCAITMTAEQARGLAASLLNAANGPAGAATGAPKSPPTKPAAAKSRAVKRARTKTAA